MVGLWRRCCSPPPKYQPPGGGRGESVLFAVRAANVSNLSTWVASDTKLLPQLKANGYEAGGRVGGSKVLIPSV